MDPQGRRNMSPRKPAGSCRPQGCGCTRRSPRRSGPVPLSKKRPKAPVRWVFTATGLSSIWGIRTMASTESEGIAISSSNEMHSDFSGLVEVAVSAVVRPIKPILNPAFSTMADGSKRGNRLFYIGGKNRKLCVLGIFAGWRVSKTAAVSAVCSCALTAFVSITHIFFCGRIIHVLLSSYNDPKEFAYRRLVGNPVQGKIIHRSPAFGVAFHADAHRDGIAADGKRRDRRALPVGPAGDLKRNRLFFSVRYGV